ncbi:MAG: hypothetical protein P4N59_20925 [Negativicutes bacterium]|nr:hypothetical protein [Negativicutes bacterium]
MKIKILGILLGCLVVFLISTTCFAAEPQRIAILPVINQSYTHDDGVERVIADAVAAKFHMPLDKIVIIYDVIPAAEVRAAVSTAADLGVKAKNFDMKKLAEIATKLNADVVIGAIITEFSESQLITMDSGLSQQTSISLRIVGYRALEKKTFDLSSHEEYTGEWSNTGNADYLAGVIMERLLGKLSFPYTKG